MTRGLAHTFDDLAHILGVCPNEECGQLFYLSEARPFLRGKQPRSIIDSITAEELRLEAAEDKLSLLEEELRENAARAGLRVTKRLLKKIDPVFSGAGYDPQDVKVIFDPVTYVVFNGLSEKAVKDVELLGRPAHNRETERVHNSIERSVRTGNFEFKTLHVNNEGQIISK